MMLQSNKENAHVNNHILTSAAMANRMLFDQSSVRPNTYNNLNSAFITASNIGGAGNRESTTNNSNNNNENNNSNAVVRS
jgi:hypothetical protein